MAKVELLLHPRGNMHHYPGILIFCVYFRKMLLSSLAIVVLSCQDTHLSTL